MAWGIHGNLFDLGSQGSVQLLCCLIALFLCVKSHVSIGTILNFHGQPRYLAKKTNTCFWLVGLVCSSTYKTKHYSLVNKTLYLNILVRNGVVNWKSSNYLVFESCSLTVHAKSWKISPGIGQLNNKPSIYHLGMVYSKQLWSFEGMVYGIGFTTLIMFSGHTALVCISWYVLVGLSAFYILWRFPKIRVPPVIIHFNRIIHISYIIYPYHSGWFRFSPFLEQKSHLKRQAPQTSSIEAWPKQPWKQGRSCRCLRSKTKTESRCKFPLKIMYRIVISPRKKCRIVINWNLWYLFCIFFEDCYICNVLWNLQLYRFKI